MEIRKYNLHDNQFLWNTSYARRRLKTDQAGVGDEG
jgi:hypothetical protein